MRSKLGFRGLANPRRPSPEGEPPPRAERGAAGGFTLVELLVALAVAGIFLSLLYQAFLVQERSYRVQEDVADARQNARVAVDELSRALMSLGAGTDVEGGQPRFLVAHENEITFTANLSADHDAQTPGATVPGAGTGDPYGTFPPGTYAGSPAETYRYRLVRRSGEDLFTLMREINGGPDQAVALLIADPDRAGPLFRYWGDFDGNGTEEWLDRVDRATSPRLAAGEPLEVLVRRIEIRVVTEPPRPDPRFPGPGGVRQTRLVTSVTPRNLWDCPRVVPASTLGPLRAPDLRGTTTPVEFRVLRGSAPEEGRTVRFTLTGPSGHGVALASTQAATDADGYVQAQVVWPPACADLPEGTYTVTARTAEPPTLLTPFGACTPRQVTMTATVGPGLPQRVAFDLALLEVSSCGGEGQTGFRVLDACDRLVDPADAAAHPAELEIGPDPEFGTLEPRTLDQPSGVLVYRSRSDDYSRYAVPRSPADPNRFPAWIQTDTLSGRVDVEVILSPRRLLGPTAHIPSTAFTDCPDPSVPVVDTFGVEDACGNALWTLAGTGEAVRTELVPQSGPATDQGAISSPGNRATLSPDPVDVVRPDPSAVAPGTFSVAYLPPTCSVGGIPYAPRLRLTPTWALSGPSILPVHVAPCTGCGVRVLDVSGTAATSWSRACEGQMDVLVTQCVPAGTTVELVVVPRLGSLGLPSFDRNRPLQRARVTFSTAGPGQTARLPLYLGSAQTGDGFRIKAYVPDQATSSAMGGVSCASELVSVDTACSEILISAVADNPGAVPNRPRAEDTPLCAAEGNAVFFRVKDCDQNRRDYAADDIQRTVGSTRGLVVQVLDTDGTVLDEEGPDLFEVDVHGTRATDSPYFQGSLVVTQDPTDTAASGRLFAPSDRVVTVRATYFDPDDPTDRNCVAEALLVPPLPLCLTLPAATFGDWTGPLTVHGGDAVVAGDWRLPPAPVLVAKEPTAPLLGTLRTDRFLNVYVGGVVSVGGAALTPAEEVDQPFVPGGPGASVSTAHPNVFQNVPGAAGLASRLNYDRLKLLARARGVYWEPAGGGLLRNPRTGVVAGFQELTGLPGPGGATAFYDGRFVFIDAPAGLRSGALLDAASATDLPTYEVAGDYFTEGLVYVAGNVTFLAPGPTRTVPVAVPASGDARYDEATAPPGRDELPLGVPFGSTPSPAGDLGAHARAALYAAGIVRFAGPWRWYGAVTGEKGVVNQGGAVIWYDPTWNGSRPDLCTRCCGLRLAPPALSLAPGDLGTVSAVGADGATVWQSLNPSVALVDPAGAVEALAEGTTALRATDGAGCVAESEVLVSCGLRLEMSPPAGLRPGDRATVSALGLHGTPVWSVDTPSVVSIVANLGPTVQLEALAPGAARVEALDTNGCTAGLDLAVSCPAAGIVFTPTDPAVGDRVDLSVWDGGDDLTARYAFSVDGVDLAGRGLVLGQPGPRTVEARMTGAPCGAGPTVLTPRCPHVAMAASTPSARVGVAFTVSATGPTGQDWTDRFTWSVAPDGAARLFGSEVTPAAPGTLIVTGDWAGCPAGPLEIPVSP